jgi:hypothetical protein
VQRYKWSKVGSFEPFPYRPKNAAALLDNPRQTIIAELEEFPMTRPNPQLCLAFDCPGGNPRPRRDY